MKQKIVIQIKMDCEKCTNKALKTAAEVKGVTTVSLGGDDRDRVEVTGDNVDTIHLINQLNKKFKCVTVLTIEEVKKKPPEKPEPPKKDPKKEEKTVCATVCLVEPPHGTCSKCGRKCEHCSKCQSPKCQCKCVIICFKCNNNKCDGQCCICIKCKSPSCSGHCYTPCPPWCTCPRCYVPCNPPPCTYRVVYESNPDNCSIM